MGRYRVTIQEAASRLGVKEPAIRKRIERGSLQKEKDEDGRVFVYVDEPPIGERDAGHDAGHDGSYPTGYDALTTSQQQQIEFLQRELEHRTEEIRRRDVIISQLTQRIPEIEPSRDADLASAEEAGPNPADEREAPEQTQRRSWWREFFGFH